MVTIFNKLKQTITVTLKDIETGVVSEQKIDSLGIFGPIEKERVTELTVQLATRGHIVIRDAQ